MCIYIYFYLWIYKIVVLLVSCCHSRNDHHQAVFSLNKVLVYGGINVTNFSRLRVSTEKQEGKKKYKSDGGVMVGEFVCVYVCACTGE